MKKKYKIGIFFGIILYLIIYGFFNVSRLICLSICLGMSIIAFTYMYIYELKLSLRNLKYFVDSTNQSSEIMILEYTKQKKCMHDIKNDLFFIKDMLNKGEQCQVQKKIDNLLIECFQNDSPAICTNIYVNSFLTYFISKHPQINIDIKINVPEKINMKPIDLSTLMLCLLKDEFATGTRNMKFYMSVNENELVVRVIYCEQILSVDNDVEMLLEIFAKNYQGDFKIKKNEISCILFL